MLNVVDVDLPEFDKEILKSSILTLVEFWHQQCPWCARLEPIYQELAAEYKGKVKFTKFNILANPYNKELAARMGIMGTPTFLFFCKGRSLQMMAGFMTRIQLKKAVDDMLQRGNQCLEQSTELKQDFERFYA